MSTKEQTDCQSEPPLTFLYKDATDKLASAEVYVQKLEDHLTELRGRPGVPAGVLADVETRLAEARNSVTKHDRQRQYFRGCLFGDRHPKIQLVES